MKDKILTLIIGILIGAIIATAGFIVYTKINEKNNVNNRSQMMMREKGDKQGMFPDMQNGENGSTNNRKGGKQATTDANTENNQPPEMPNGEQLQGNPPEMPSKNSNL